jgi:hypothetical protein
VSDHAEEVVAVVQRKVGPVPFREEVLIGKLALQREKRRQGARPLASLFVELRVRCLALLLDRGVLLSALRRLREVRTRLIGLACRTEHLVRIVSCLLDYRIGDARVTPGAPIHLVVALVPFLTQALVGVVAMGTATGPRRIHGSVNCNTLGVAAPSISCFSSRRHENGQARSRRANRTPRDALTGRLRPR